MTEIGSAYGLVTIDEDRDDAGLRLCIKDGDGRVPGVSGVSGAGDPICCGGLNVDTESPDSEAASEKSDFKDKRSSAEKDGDGGISFGSGIIRDSIEGALLPARRVNQSCIVRTDHLSVRARPGTHR